MKRYTGRSVQRALVFYLTNRLLCEILEGAVDETGAKEWGGTTGCFMVAPRTLEERWDELLRAGVEVSQAACRALCSAIKDGTDVERNRLGSEWVAPVLTHIRDHWHEAPTLRDSSIWDTTSVGPIWETAVKLLEPDIELIMPNAGRSR